jgi:pimeloyl-ACP methyl ester carboxylesterase
MQAFIRSFDRARIAYEVLGSSGTSLVLVHGWCCDRTYWDLQIAPLAVRWRVVRLDLAGHGQSDCERTGWSMAAFGADVSAVVSAAGLTDTILVGHSMGADVVLEAARLMRGRVRGLVWVDRYNQLSTFMSEAQVQERIAPFRTSFTETTRTFVQRMFPSRADASLIERVASHMSSAPEPMALAVLEATWNHGRSGPGLLAELDLPVVAINAEHPSTDTPSMREHGVEVLLMPDVGHFPMLEKPADFNACLARAVELVFPTHTSM